MLEGSKLIRFSFLEIVNTKLRTTLVVTSLRERLPMSEDSGGNFPHSSSSGKHANGTNKSTKTNQNKRGDPVKKPAFQGAIADLKDAVYDTGPVGKDPFARTTRKIAEYIATNYKWAGDFKTALDPNVLEFQPVVYPADPSPNANCVAMKKWELEGGGDKAVFQCSTGTMLTQRPGLFGIPPLIFAAPN